MKIRFHLLVLSAVLLLNAAPLFAADSGEPAAAALPAAQQQVHYDPATDRLTLDVRDMSLTQLLARISAQTGVEILIDPALERPVTVAMQDQPLEAGLTTLTREYNTVMIHDQRDVPGKGSQTLLITIKLLPRGQTNTALLRPALSPEAEAVMRASGRDPAGTPGNAGGDARVSARRAARLEKMTPEQRAKIEQIETDKARRKAQMQADRAEQKAKRQKRQVEDINRQLAKAQARMDTDPEFYQQRIQALTERLGRIQNGTSSPPQ